MKNKKFRVIALILALMLIASSSALAHSGRTDASGGHRDNRNVSGLGSYHYHHGYGPHLHTNGVCPYDSTANTTITTAPTVKTTPVQQPTQSVTSKPAPQTTITVSIDNYTINPTSDSGVPFIDSSSRTQVPLRLTMEECGCTVTWDNASKTAYVIKGDKTVSVPIGKHYIVINGTQHAIDTCAMIKDNRTYLPIRPVLEAFGYNVAWDQSTKTVAITSAEETSSPANNKKSPDEIIGEFVMKNGRYYASENYYMYSEEETVDDVRIVKAIFYNKSRKNGTVTYGCQQLMPDGRDVRTILGPTDKFALIEFKKNSTSEIATISGHIGNSFNGDNFYDTFIVENTEIPSGAGITNEQLKQQADLALGVTFLDFQLTMYDHNIDVNLRDYGYDAYMDTFN